MSYYAYILYSESYNRYYKGHCENLDERIKQHNAGKTRSIKAFRPWKLVYYETFPTREEAINREKYFKSSAGRKYLRMKFSSLKTGVS
jgi:putative endonuclease